MPPSSATILLAHGSRDPAWHAPIEAIATHMRGLKTTALVRCAYLEHTQPDLPSAIAQLLAEGARSIRICPLLLGAGRHAREQLPQLLQAARARHPGISFELQAPITEHPAVIEAMARAALGADVPAQP